MPGQCRVHTIGDGANSTNLVPFTLSVGATTMVISVYTGMVLQTLICPSNLTATSVTMVEMSTDYNPDSGVGTWHSVYSSGNLATSVAAQAFSFYVAAGRAVRFSPSDFYSGNWYRLTFNTAQLTSDAIFINVDGQVTGT